ncbi:MAG: bacteriophage CI repressor [Bacteroidales bacterium]|nr:bacteriophage CI repressor [Bacteroidales bacterium]
MKTFSSNDILDRLKTALSISSDKELGDILGISKAAVSNWRKRNSIDLERVFSVCEHINFDWLITGRGNMTHEVKSETVNQSNSELMDRIVSQAEEIGRLKERNTQLEKEKMQLEMEISRGISPQEAARVFTHTPEHQNV